MHYSTRVYSSNLEILGSARMTWFEDEQQLEKS